MKSSIRYACSILLMVMWTYAALSKLFVYEQTRFDWLSHELIKNHASLLAWLVPTIELLIVALLLFPRSNIYGLYSSVTLLGLFTIYILYMFIFYPNTPCSCGGIVSTMSWKQHVMFNLACMGIGGIGIINAGNKDHSAALASRYS